MKFPDRKCVRLGLAGAMSLTLAACASGPTDQPVSNYFDCDALHQVVDSADSGFDELKGAGQTNRYGQFWRARVQAFEDSCTVVSASGPTYYSCSGQIQEVDATEQLTAASSDLQQCLGSEWRMTRGEDSVRFSPEAAASPSVTAKSFANDRGRQMIEMRVGS